MSDEYPKHILVDGVTITATDAADEARWRQPAAVTTTAPDEQVADLAPDVPVPDVLDDPDGAPPSDPLDDIELEGAALNNGHVPEPELESKLAKSEKQQ